MTICNDLAPSFGWLEDGSGDFDSFRRLTARKTLQTDVPLADNIQHNVPVYNGRFVNTAACDNAARHELLAEWATVLGAGAGIIVIQNGMLDHETIDQATGIFEHLIEIEKTATDGGGDHFAQAGANNRIWNALEKHCLHDPHNFARYYATHGINMAAEAWLGPGYQVTAQVNLVNPGGAAQNPHRDYHLGFMTIEQAAAYPAHIHKLSAFLTLQGAVAHCDMPVESGPTQLLPFSQTFTEGYIAFSKPEFQNYFAEHFVQIPLQKGDLLFFNPAVMHAAGHNRTTDVHRMANLLQISSAFGRAMEAINRRAMSIALYPEILSAKNDERLSEQECANAIAACAEGYAFPTSLDRDPPTDGLAPTTQAQFFMQAVNQNHALKIFEQTLEALHMRQFG